MTDIPNYSTARSAGVLKGADLIWRGMPGNLLRYDVEIGAGSMLPELVFDFEGASQVSVDPRGSLLVEAPRGRLRHSPPLAWQEADGRRIPVACRFESTGSSARLVVGHRDPALRLVIDPTITVDVTFGAGNVTSPFGVGVDEAGSVVVGGYTRVPNQGTNGAYQPGKAGAFSGDDLFVAKFQKGSASLAWFTYLGGAADDRYGDIALDSSGNVCVVGQTFSSNFPTVNALRSVISGGRDAICAKISASGSSLIFSTYLGGTGFDIAEAVTVDPQGGIWVGGGVDTPDLPLVNPVDNVGQGGEAFVLRLGADGSGPTFSTYLGGTLGETVYSLAAAADGTVWAVGTTNSTDFPLKSAVQGSYGGGPYDAFLVGFAPGGTSIVYSSYLGGSSQDEGYAVAADMYGDVYVSGFTYSTDFPVSSALQSTHGGTMDAYLFKLKGSTLGRSFSTFLGSAGEEYATDLAENADGDVFITGSTTSSGFPMQGAVDGTYNGGSDSFLTLVRADGGAILFSTFLGGTTAQVAAAVATDGGIAAVASGRVPGTGNPVAGAMQVVQFLPEPLRFLTASSVGQTRVDLAWTDTHAGAYAVEVQRRSIDGPFSTVANLAAGTTSWSDTTVAEDAIYDYRVRGTSMGGDTGWSSRLRVMTLLLAPGAAVATGGTNDHVGLSWMDLSGVETGYQVIRKPGPGGVGAFSVVATVPAGATSFNDTTVAPETSYEYRVQTVGPSGAIAPSPVLTVTTAPRDPTGLFVSVQSDTTAKITWVDNSAAESGVQVQRRDVTATGEFLDIGSAGESGTQFLDESITGERSYAWRVRAINADGASHWSSVVPGFSPPVAPSDLLFDRSIPQEVRLSWTDLSSVEQGFRIDRKGPLDASFQLAGIVGSNVTEFQDTGLVQGATFTYRVRSYGTYGSSGALIGDLDTGFQLVISKATRTPAKGTKVARLTVTGWYDPGLEAPVPGVPSLLRVGDASFAIPGFSPGGSLLRYQEPGLRVDLRTSSEGASRVAFNVLAEGPAAEALDPGGVLFLSLSVGEVTAAGRGRLEGGRLDPAKGVGALESPALRLISLKANVARPGRDVLAVKAVLPPAEAPGPESPVVRIALGTALDVTFPSGALTLSEGKWVLAPGEGSSWTVVLDVAKGTLTVKGKGLDLGEYPAIPLPLRIVVQVGEHGFVGEPVLPSNGHTLSY